MKCAGLKLLPSVSRFDSVAGSEYGSGNGQVYGVARAAADLRSVVRAGTSLDFPTAVSGIAYYESRI